MSALFQRWIKTMGARRLAVVFSLCIAAAVTAAAAIGGIVFVHTGWIDHHMHLGEIAVIGLAAFLVAIAVTVPSFAAVKDLLDKEQDLEDLVGEMRVTRDRLRVSETRFRHIAEAASDWFWEMDADLRFSYFSPRAAEIVGVPVEFHIGKTRAELAGEDVQTEKWQRHLNDLARHRAFRDFRFVRKGHDGRLQTLSTSGKPMFDASGAFAGYIGVGSDITAQLDAEESARVSQERLAYAIEELWEMFALWGPDDRMVICNEQYRQFNAGVAEMNTPGTLFLDHLHAALEAGLYPSAAGREEEWTAERIARHENPGDAFELERQNGKWLFIREQKFPDGSVATVSMDITDRKSAEAELIAAKEAAEAASRSKSDFLARMSHELRTPLNAILGFSQIIRDEAFGPIGVSAYADYANDINSSGEMLLSLINDLLDLSRIEAGKLELEDAAVDLREAAEDVVRLFEREAAANGVAIGISIPATLPRLSADARAVRQILMNLVSNAIKFTDASGTVDIDAEATSLGLVLSVADTGIGFPESKIETILSPFGRLDQAQIATAGGTGLGLSIVKSLMELHGGTVGLESAPGAGTVVRLTFPADRTLTAEPVTADAD